jgi:hypothetical protein
LTLVPALAREISPAGKNLSTPAEIFGHGTLRRTDRSLEAVVEVGANLISNIQAGQQVLMDVRQGQLRGVVKSVNSPLEVTIALDGQRSSVNLSRLQPGQAVIAVIQLDSDCDGIPLEL